MSSGSATTTFALKEQGETLTFFGEADSRAPVLEFEVLMAPGASGPEAHIHPRQSERFAVLSGWMLAKVDGNEHLIGPGEELLVGAGQVHGFKNGSDGDPLVFRCIVEPALNFQWLLTESAKSAIRSGGSWKDASLLESAYILHQVPGEYRIAGMPALLQNVLIGTLATAARVLGKTKHIQLPGERPKG